MADPALARTLDDLRKAQGLSKNKLAGLVGVNRTQVGRWMDGQGVPSAANIDRLAEIFQVDADWLLKLAGYRRGRPEREPVDPRKAGVLALIDRSWDQLEEPQRWNLETIVRALASLGARGLINPYLPGCVAAS